MSTWGWVYLYGLTALLFLVCLTVFLFAWGKDRLWRWQDHRAAVREARVRRTGGDAP
jgi:hypothetical protein